MGAVCNEAERECGEEERHHTAADVLEAQAQQERIVDVEVRAVRVDERGAPDEKRCDRGCGADDDAAALA